MAKRYGSSNIMDFKAAEKRRKDRVKSASMNSIFESPRSKSQRLSTAAGKANRSATDKMYAAESMFKSAQTRDKAKVKRGNVTPATARDRAKVKMPPKGSIKRPKPALDAETIKSYKKRIAYMEKRKAAGKNYSKKNLAELKAKLK
tara:strand:- start:708 stop:1145 length:438 start_codon:yes stop_codon:yes gene_type:complete